MVATIDNCLLRSISLGWVKELNVIQFKIVFKYPSINKKYFKDEKKKKVFVT